MERINTSSNTEINPAR